MSVITYPCWDLSKTVLVKGGPGNYSGPWRPMDRGKTITTITYYIWALWGNPNIQLNKIYWSGDIYHTYNEVCARTR